MLRALRPGLSDKGEQSLVERPPFPEPPSEDHSGDHSAVDTAPSRSLPKTGRRRILPMIETARWVFLVPMTTVLEGLFQWGIQFSRMLPEALGASVLVLCLAGFGASRLWHDRNHDDLSGTAFLVCASAGAAAVVVTIAGWLYAVERCNDLEESRFEAEGCANVPGAVEPKNRVLGSP